MLQKLDSRYRRLAMHPRGRAVSLSSSLTSNLLILLLLASLSCTSQLAQAQQALGIIEGTVTDSSGAVVPSAGVKLTNPDTGFARTTSTQGNGAYKFDGLPAGTYVLTFTKEGFSSARYPQIIVHATRTT